MSSSALHVYQCAFQSWKYKSGCFPLITCPLLAEQRTIVSSYGLFQLLQAENWSRTEKENTVVDHCETAQICLFILETKLYLGTCLKEVCDYPVICAPCYLSMVRGRKEK